MRRSLFYTLCLSLMLLFSFSSSAQYSIVVSGPSDICGTSTTSLSVTPSGGLSFKWYAYAAYPFGMWYSTDPIWYNPETGYWICEVTTASGVFVTPPVLIRKNLPYITAPNGSSGCGSSTGIVLSDYNAAMYSMPIYSTYQWKLNGVAIPGATNWQYQPTVSGVYTLTIGISCGSGISNPITVSIDNPISSSTSITASGSTTFCQGGSVSLSVPSVATSYQWKRNGTNISGAVSSSYVATQSGNFTCVLSNSCNSITTFPVSVTVNTAPAATITASGATTFCQGGSVTLSAPTGAGYSYQWNRNGTTVSGATSSTYVASQSGSYTVTVSSSGCSSTSTALNVTVNPLPTVSFSGLATSYTCQTPPVTLTGSPSGGTFSGSGISGNQFRPATLANGTYAITYSYTNSSGCSSSAVQTSSVVAGYNCLQPQNLTITSGTATSVSLRWDFSSSSQFQVRYKKSSQSTYTTVTFNAATCQNSYVLTGLRRNTQYDISIRSYCSASTASSWSNTVVYSSIAARMAGGIQENDEWILFPNPIQQEIHIKIPSDVLSSTFDVSIFNMHGVSVFSAKVNAENVINLPADHLASGIYFIRLDDSFGNYQFMKFNKQ